MLQQPVATKPTTLLQQQGQRLQRRQRQQEHWPSERPLILFGTRRCGGPTGRVIRSLTSPWCWPPVPGSCSWASSSSRSVATRAALPGQMPQLLSLTSAAREGLRTFGKELDGAELDLSHSESVATLMQHFHSSGGLLRIRNVSFSPQELVHFTSHFGTVEQNPGVPPQYLMPDLPEVQVIGNVRDVNGQLRAMFAKEVPLSKEHGIRYDPARRTPVWHTDQLFRSPMPTGSCLYCVTSPPEGADTCFADMAAAFEALPEDVKAILATKEVICSYAHHNAKIQKRTPTYPLLTPQQRAAHPPQRRPLISKHPVTQQECLMCFNSSVCMVVDKGVDVSTNDLDRFELEGEEDSSVGWLYQQLLPFATQSSFSLRHKWQPGDLVVWDNRSTIHAATAFDNETYQREMWRTTFIADCGDT